jgi:hypothetical protein
LGEKKSEWSNCNNLEVFFFFLGGGGGGRGIKYHFLNIRVKSANEWIVQGVKCIFLYIYIYCMILCTEMSTFFFFFVFDIESYLFKYVYEDEVILPYDLHALNENEY